MKNNMMKLNEEVGDLHFMNPTTLGWMAGERDNKKNDACKNLQASLYIVFGVCLILHIIYQC